MRLFVDTTVWVAAADLGDRDHERAASILRRGDPLVTTDHVVVESWNHIARRLGRYAAERFWDELRGGVASVECVGPADLERARAMPGSGPPAAIGIRTSFAVMERLGLQQVATFRPAFGRHRYGRERDRCFEIQEGDPGS